MSNLRVAQRYAVALNDSAPNQNQLDALAGDFATIRATLQGSHDLRLLLASPIVPAAKKASVFRALFGNLIGKSTMDFLGLLIAKRREALLPDIILQFHALRDERMGIVTVDVASAIAFTDVQQRNLESRLEQYTRKKVRIRFALDKAVKGGIVVRVGDTVIDTSLRRQLEMLRERFVAGGPLAN